MAKSTVKKVALKLKYAGAIVEGKQTYITKTYNKIKQTASDQALLDVAVILSGLQKYTVSEIAKTTETGLEA